MAESAQQYKCKAKPLTLSKQSALVSPLHPPCSPLFSLLLSCLLPAIRSLDSWRPLAWSSPKTPPCADLVYWSVCGRKSSAIGIPDGHGVEHAGDSGHHSDVLRVRGAWALGSETKDPHLCKKCMCIEQSLYLSEGHSSVRNFLK